MQLIDVLNNIDFDTFESATGCVGDLQYTFKLRNKLNIPPAMQGDWRDYIIRNCNVLNANRIKSGLASIDMLMTFSVQGVVYAMEIVIEDAPKQLTMEQYIKECIEPAIKGLGDKINAAIANEMKLDDVDIVIDAVVDNGKRRTRGPNKPKQGA